MTATWIEAANSAPTLIERIRALLLGGEDSNLVIWPSVSEQAIRDINALLASGATHLAPASPITYLCDGAMPRLPVAKTRYR